MILNNNIILKIHILIGFVYNTTLLIDKTLLFTSDVKHDIICEIYLSIKNEKIYRKCICQSGPRKLLLQIIFCVLNRINLSKVIKYIINKYILINKY